MPQGALEGVARTDQEAPREEPLHCGKPAKRYRCQACRKKHNRGHDRTRFRKNKVWKVAGLCTKCGKEAALPDRSLGPNCVEERRIRYQQNEKSKNKEKNQARYKAWREQSIALGLCTYCKDGKAEPGKRKCEDCNEIARTKKRIKMANNQMRRRIERGEKIRKVHPPAALAEAMT